MMNAPLRLSADDRAVIRKAITSHDRWKDYRAASGMRVETMTTEQILKAASDLQIDVGSIIGKPVDVPVSEAIARAEFTSAPRVSKDAAYENFPFSAPAPKASAPKTDDSDIAALGKLIAKLAGQSIDMEQVNSAIDAKLSGIAPAIAEVASAVVAKALANTPSVKIEIHKAGEAREVKGHAHPCFAKLVKSVSVRMGNGYAPSVWLSGPAGSGKTHAGHQLADALGVAFHLNGALSMPHELLGFIDAAGTYHRTPFREAYEHGGVYMFDEVDGSDNSALLALNAALANGFATFPDGKIKRHADCYIVASANTFGLGATAEYVGRAKIDAAFLSRFPVRISWDYDTALEIAISGHESFARRVIRAREKARSAGLKVLINPRASQAGGALVAAGVFTEAEAAEMTYLANLTAEQRRIIGE